MPARAVGSQHRAFRRADGVSPILTTRSDPPKTSHLETAPQLGTVMTTSNPLDPRQVVFERTLAHSEYIGSLTSKHLSDETPAMSGESYDCLYGDARLSLFEN